MFSQTVEYALRAACYLGINRGRPCTTSSIAEATKVPPAYLSKVLQALNRAGLVQSQRGLGGGISLVEEPDQITILQVVNAVEPIRRIKTCPLELESHGVQLCPLHQRMDRALEHVETAFRNTLLAEVLSESTTSVPLCNFPPQVADDVETD